MIKILHRQSRAYYLLPIIAGIIILPITLSFAASLYKWVDENGKTHYGDRIPPSEMKREHTEINKDGAIIRTIGAELNKDQRAQARRDRELKKKEQEKARRRAIRDQNLIETYSSSSEIMLVRDEHLGRLDHLIGIASAKIERLVFDRLDLTSNAANDERVGEVPESVQSQIKNIDKKIAHQQEFIANKAKEKDDVSALFEEDIRRFRQLAGK